MFLEKEGKLIYSYDGETVCIEAWGKDALRVRATKNRSFTGRDWALEAKDAHAGEVEIFEDPSAKGGAFAGRPEGPRPGKTCRGGNGYFLRKNHKRKASCSDRFRQRHYVLS